MELQSDYLHFMCMICSLYVSAFISIHPSMRVCTCVSWQASHNISAPCRAVTAYSTAVAGAARIRKNNMKQFKNHVSERMARDWKRLSNFLPHLSCNWKLYSQPVGGSRDRVDIVRDEANSSHFTGEKKGKKAKIEAEPIVNKVKV